MKAIATKTVRELALENPGATRVFENLGIDYCCGGHKPLEDACANANVSVDDVLRRLDDARAQASRLPDNTDWQKASITTLVTHIVDTHHVYVKEEAPRLQQLISKVSSVHGNNHPELMRVQELFGDLAQELSMHLMKEEQILFPYLLQMDEAVTHGTTAPPPMFGSVVNPVRMMMVENDSAGEALRELREITSNYSVPPDGCVSYQTLYKALQDFEKDLHQHIHLENNILFPRALDTEAAA